MRSTLMLVVGSVLGAGILEAQSSPQPMTIEQITGAPFAQALATGGGTVAWVHNTRGVRNVWVATGAELKSRQLTSYTQDDGQEIEEVAVSPDGKTIFYVRGGDPNRRGEIPNPTSDRRRRWRSRQSGQRHRTGGLPAERSGRVYEVRASLDRAGVRAGRTHATVQSERASRRTGLVPRWKQTGVHQQPW